MTAGEQYEMVRAAVRRSCIRCFGTGEIAQNYLSMGQTADWQVVPCPECGGRKVIAALEEMQKGWEMPENFHQTLHVTHHQCHGPSAEAAARAEWGDSLPAEQKTANACPCCAERDAVIILLRAKTDDATWAKYPHSMQEAVDAEYAKLRAGRDAAKEAVTYWYKMAGDRQFEAEKFRAERDEAIRTRTLAQAEAVELQLTVRAFRDEKWCFNPGHTENKEQ